MDCDVSNNVIEPYIYLQRKMGKTVSSCSEFESYGNSSSSSDSNESRDGDIVLVSSYPGSMRYLVANSDESTITFCKYVVSVNSMYSNDALVKYFCNDLYINNCGDKDDVLSEPCMEGKKLV